MKNSYFSHRSGSKFFTHSDLFFEKVVTFFWPRLYMSKFCYNETLFLCSWASKAFQCSLNASTTCNIAVHGIPVFPTHFSSFFIIAGLFPSKGTSTFFARKNLVLHDREGTKMFYKFFSDILFVTNIDFKSDKRFFFLFCKLAHSNSLTGI